MTTPALIFWLSTVGVFTGFCGYFFYRILTAKKKDEPDSFTEND